MRNGYLFGFLVMQFLSLNSSYAQYKIGDIVNNFTLNAIDGKSHTLYDYSGKVVLLNFFATW